MRVRKLLSRKNKHKRNNCSEDLEGLDNEMSPKIPRKVSLSESERLIRDTLLHESKTMVPEHTRLDRVNGLLGYKDDKRKPRRGHSLNGIIPSPKKTKKRKRNMSSVTDKELTVKLNDHLLNGDKNHMISNGHRFSKNPLRDSGEGDHILCSIETNYMKIVLNNAAKHNILTLNVRMHFFFIQIQHLGSYGAIHKSYDPS